MGSPPAPHIVSASAFCTFSRIFESLETQTIPALPLRHMYRLPRNTTTGIQHSD